MFFFFSFLFCKIGEQEGRTGPAQGGGLVPVGKVVGKRDRMVNTVQKCVYVHVNAKMIPVETVA
jgi:hypothetical protein